jgi:hypothetical protein
MNIDAILALMADGTDVAVDAIFAASGSQASADSHRKRQQVVGAIFSRLNKKAKDHHYGPGEQRGTYRRYPTTAL